MNQNENQENQENQNINGGQPLPPQGQGNQIPPEGWNQGGPVPPQGQGNQIPPEGWNQGGPMPPQGQGNQMPPQGWNQGGPVPPQGQGNQMPPQGWNQGGSVPPQGQGNQIPPEGWNQGGPVPPLSTPGMYEKKKPPKWYPIVAAASGIAVLALVAALLFGTGILAASPKAALKKIESRSTATLIDVYSLMYSESLDTDENEGNIESFGSDISAELSISEEAQSLLGVTDLNSFKIDGSIDYDQNMFKMAGGLLLNGESLFSVDGYLTSEKMLMAIPELSKEYLKYDLETIIDVDLGLDGSIKEGAAPNGNMLKDRPSVSEMNKMLEAYSKIWLDSIENVKREKGVKLEIGNDTKKSDLYTVTYTEKETLTLLLNILLEAKEDDLLLRLVTENTEYSADYFKNSIDDAITTCREEIEYATDNEFFIMQVWINRNKIIGRNIRVISGSEKMDFTYKAFSSGEKQLFYFAMLQNDTELLSIDGDLESGKTGTNGSVTLSITEDNQESYIAVDLKDLMYSSSKEYSGSLVISSNELMGMSIGCQYDVKDKAGSVNMNLLLGTMEIGSLKLTAENRKIQPFTVPAESYDAEDEEQLEAYLENADKLGFIEKLSSNESLQSLFEQFGIFYDWSTLFENNNSSYDDYDYNDEEEPYGADDSASGTYTYPDGESEFIAYPGYSVDGNGWVSFEMDRDEVIQRGEGSTGFLMFRDTDWNELKVQMDAIAKNLIGEDAGYDQYDGECQIEGYEPNVYSYYYDDYVWQDVDIWSNYLTANVDFVTNTVLGVEVSYEDSEKCIEAAALLYKALTGDKEDISLQIKIALDDGETSLIVDKYILNFYESEDGLDITIYPYSME